MGQINEYKRDIQQAIKCLEAIESSKRWKLTNYDMLEDRAANIAITSLRATLYTLEHHDTLQGVNYVLFQAMKDIEVAKYANSHD